MSFSASMVPRQLRSRRSFVGAGVEPFYRQNVGWDAWLDKLIAARNRFEHKSPTGARFKLHPLSLEAGLPFLSWEDNCQSCVKNSFRASREAFLSNQPYWRTRISSELYQVIETLQSLFESAGREFDEDPTSEKGESRRPARRDRGHPPSAESGAPCCWWIRVWIPPPLDEVSSP